MTSYYKDSNFEGSRDLFTKRMVYNADVQDFKTTYPNFVDFNFAEKFLYGRVDRLHIPMVYIGSINRSAMKNQSRSTALKNVPKKGSLTHLIRF